LRGFGNWRDQPKSISHGLGIAASDFGKRRFGDFSALATFA